MPIRIEIEKPPDFNFNSTVRSHGWYSLLPFQLDEEKGTLRYVFLDEAGKSISAATISANGKTILVEAANQKVQQAKIIRDVHRILRLDENLKDFHTMADVYDGTKWAVAAKAGRLLRSPTVFEDLIKTLCTTNCSWALTKAMVTNLVEKLGVGGKNARAFPTAKAMAGADEKFYREEIKAGYRSPFFVELANKVASCEIDPETWLRKDISTEDLRKDIKSIKGIGDYAADNLLKLLGRYDGLALDSWLRKRFAEKHNRGKVCKDAKIEKHYAKFGDWRGLAIWCDMTEDWFE